MLYLSVQVSPPRKSPIRSVTANTRHDGQDFSDISSRFAFRITVHEHSFVEAARALSDLAHDRIKGATVLTGFDD